MVKRKYSHKKGRDYPTEHGSPYDQIDHAYGGSGFGHYKTKRKSKKDCL